MSANLLQTINTGLGKRTSQAPERVDFSKISTAVRIPNLIEIQRESYNRFLQMDFLPEERENTGLQAVFQSVFPISDFRGTATLDFVEYQIGNWQCKCGRLEGLNYLRANCKQCGATVKVNPLAAGEKPCPKSGTFNFVRPQLCENCGEPVGLKHKHDQQECQERGMSYSVPLKVKIRLTVYDKDPDTNVKSIRDIKEEEVFFGEIPLMTDNGTFIINGTERVIVSQLHRSPGVFFKRGQLFVAKIIPYRGSWVEFEYDQKNLLYVRVGKRKFLATIFLRALGAWLQSNFNSKSFGSDGQLEEAVKNASFTDEDIIRHFYVVDEVRVEDSRLMVQVPEAGKTNLVGMKVDFEIKGRGPDPIVRKGKEISRTSLEGLRKANIGEVEIESGQFEGAYAASDVVNTETGEVVVEANNEITPAKLQEIIQTGVKEFSVFFPESDDVGVVISQTLKKDTVTKPVDALLEIYRKMRPGDPPTVQTAYRLLEGMFFDPRKFDFSRVGRLKFNIKMGKPEMNRIEDPLLQASDFFEVVTYVLKMRRNPVDDEKRPIYQADDIDHLGNRRVRAVGELLENQFRIGLERMERAIKEKMSIHQEMQTTMPRDLIEAPYRKVVNGSVVEFVRVINGGGTKFKPGDHVPQDDVDKANKRVGASGEKASYEPFPFYLTAWEEDKHVVGQANIALDENSYIVNERNAARKAGEFILAHREEIEYVDVSPKQLVSVAASLIPFLENDDANRALMGSNMQRQSVPLLRAEAPYIGTGMEDVTARDSGAVVIARRDGTVDYVDSERIIVRADHNVDGTISREVTADIYTLIKFKRSNQNTCINQRPIVHVGERVAKGQVIADGPCTDRGELALGRNVLVAFMPWRGYNFEDAILVSERLVKEDYYTSIHIEELEIEARDTKLGPEEITRDIPNVGENMLRDLDESGIIRIGAQVKPGSILVGKVTPKGETQLTAEEKLLRAIFGEKAADVKDASLVSPPGIDGTVVDVQVFTRKGQEKDQRSMSIEEEEEERLRRDLEDEIRILHEQRNERIYELFEGRKLAQDLTVNREVVITKGVPITREMLQGIEPKALRKAEVAGSRVDAASEVKEYEDRTARQIKILSDIYEEQIAMLRQGDELSPGVIKMVKVFIAMKRKLSVGDKMAGRHGNKGVIARILPEEDMPYLPDGTPVEIVLNPLGVPSRMNVGQILETHLGWAARTLGLYFSTPVFDGAIESEIKAQLKAASLPDDGKDKLYDGMTGEPFEQRVCV